MQKNPWFEEFQKNVADLIARSPAADIERNVKAFMGQTFTRMDLQVSLLGSAQARIQALESQLQALEHRISTLESGTE